MLRYLAVTCVIAILAACALDDTPKLRSSETKFDSVAASYIHKHGQSRIEGEAFVINKDGKPLYAAGELIRLVPATPYAKARFAWLYRGKTFIPAGKISRISKDPDYARYTRTTIASARGKFSFDHIAPGEYFVTAQKIHRPRGAIAAIGGAMYATVRIAKNERQPIRIVVAGQ